MSSGREHGRDSGESRKDPLILFAPYYFYVSYEPFRRVIRSLEKRGVDARMLCMHFNAYDEREAYGEERLGRDGVPRLWLELDRRAMGDRRPVARLKKLASYRSNRRRIREFLEAHRPDLVVVESDLGGLYVRSLLEECRIRRIRVAILMTLDVGSAISPRFLSGTLQKIVNTLVRGIPWLGAILHQTDMVGSYALAAPVLAPSEAVRRRLVSGGTAPDRIQVVGSPSSDAIVELREAGREPRRTEWLRSRGIPIDVRLVVVCTEVVEEVMGQEYVARCYPLLRAALDRLPDDCRVILRYHPRETTENRDFFRRTFAGPRFLEAPDAPLEEVLLFGDLTIGHFSSVLLKGLALGTPFLSINLACSSTSSLFRGQELLPEIRDDAEFAKVPLAIADREFRAELRRVLDEWLVAQSVAPDGRRSEAIAQVLHAIATDAPADERRIDAVVRG